MRSLNLVLTVLNFLRKRIERKARVALLLNFFWFVNTGCSTCQKIIKINFDLNQNPEELKLSRCFFTIPHYCKYVEISILCSCHSVFFFKARKKILKNVWLRILQKQATFCLKIQISYLIFFWRVSILIINHFVW